MKLSSIRSAIYNKVWHSPKTRLYAFLKGKCDELSHKQRLMVVTALLSVFILIAFFVFGNACYRIGRGQAAAGRIEVSHIEGVALPAPDDSGSLMVGCKITDNGFSETEKENQ